MLITCAYCARSFREAMENCPGCGACALKGSKRRSDNEYGIELFQIATPRNKLLWERSKFLLTALFWFLIAAVMLALYINEFVGTLDLIIFIPTIDLSEAGIPFFAGLVVVNLLGLLCLWGGLRRGLSTSLSLYEAGFAINVPGRGGKINSERYAFADIQKIECIYDDGDLALSVTLNDGEDVFPAELKTNLDKMILERFFTATAQKFASYKNKPQPEYKGNLRISIKCEYCDGNIYIVTENCLSCGATLPEKIQLNESSEMTERHALKELQRKSKFFMWSQLFPLCFVIIAWFVFTEYSHTWFLSGAYDSMTVLNRYADYFQGNIIVAIALISILLIGNTIILLLMKRQNIPSKRHRIIAAATIVLLSTIAIGMTVEENHIGRFEMVQNDIIAIENDELITITYEMSLSRENFYRPDSLTEFLKNYSSVYRVTAGEIGRLHFPRELSPAVLMEFAQDERYQVAGQSPYFRQFEVQKTPNLNLVVSAVPVG